MPEVVDADALRARLLRAAGHLVVQQVLGHGGEYARVRVRGVAEPQVLCQLLCEEIRHGDRAIRLRGLRWVEEILAAHARHRLVDVVTGRIEVDVGWREREHLAHAKSAPEQNLEGEVGTGLVGDGVREPQVLVLGTELHLAPVLRADLARGTHGIARQPVEAHEVVHNCGELATDGVQVRCRVRFSLRRVAFQKLVLPSDDRPRIDVAEIGLQHSIDAVALLREGGFAKPGRVVDHVGLAGGIEAHGRSPAHPLLEVALPPQGIAPRAKTALCLSLRLAPPVLVPEVHESGPAFLVLINCHCCLLFSLANRRMDSKPFLGNLYNSGVASVKFAGQNSLDSRPA